MDAPSNVPWKRTALRYARLVPPLAALVTIAIIAVYLITDNTPPWVYWAVGLQALRVVGAASLVATAAAVATFPIAVASLVVGRRGPNRATSWKLAVLSGSILLGASILEAGSAWILSRQDRGSALPAGTEQDLRNERLVQQSMPAPIDAVEAPTTFPGSSDHMSVAVLGESSAAGVPFSNWLSLGGVVAEELSRAIPGREFRPEVLAESGKTLEAQHRRLGELQHRPDVLIVFAGHNEFSARIPPSRDLLHYLDDRGPGAAGRILSALTGWSRFQALVRRNIEKCRIAIPPPSKGRRALVDAPAFTPREREALLADFRRRLETLADFAESVGAILVLIAPAANDSDFDPNRSYLPPSTPLAGRRAVEEAFLAARDLEASDPAAAEAAHEELLRLHPTFAASHWRLSRLLARRGEHPRAYRSAVSARDLDGYPMRLQTEFQDAYRDLARRRSCVFIDSQAYFHALYPDGLLDSRLFHDAMHPSFRGQLALAQAVLRGLHARRAFDWPSDAPPPVVDPASWSRRAFEDDPNVWVYLCRWGMMSCDITSGATYDPTFRLALRAGFARAANAIEAGTAPDRAGVPGIGDLSPIPDAPMNRLQGARDPQGP